MKILQKLITTLQVLEALIAFGKNVKNPAAKSSVMRDLRAADDTTKTLHISLF